MNQDESKCVMQYLWLYTFECQCHNIKSRWNSDVVAVDALHSTDQGWHYNRKVTMVKQSVNKKLYTNFVFCTLLKYFGNEFKLIIEFLNSTIKLGKIHLIAHLLWLKWLWACHWIHSSHSIHAHHFNLSTLRIFAQLRSLHHLRLFPLESNRTCWRKALLWRQIVAFIYLNYLIL